MRIFLRCLLFILVLLISTWLSLLSLDRVFPCGRFNTELPVIRCVTILHVAQIQYAQIYGSYAATLRDLVEANLIPADLAHGKKLCYSFQTTGGARHYIITASPIEANLRRSFYSDETEVIRESWGLEPAGPHSREIR